MISNLIIHGGRQRVELHIELHPNANGRKSADPTLAGWTLNWQIRGIRKGAARRVAGETQEVCTGGRTEMAAPQDNEIAEITSL